MTPKQKNELRLAMDAGENQHDETGWKNETGEKTIAKLIQSLEGDMGDDTGFTEKMMSHLNRTFPGCLGEVTGEDDEQAMCDNEGAEDEDDRDFDDGESEHDRWRDENANDTWGNWKRGGGDQPPSFKGMPKVGGGMVAQDSYRRQFPEASRIGTSLFPVRMNGDGPVTMVPRSSLHRRDRIAFGAHINSLSDDGDYAEAFPDAAKIGTLD
jgi:hypothetical protein